MGILLRHMLVLSVHMKEIYLSQGKIALVDDDDYPYLSQFKWSSIKGKRTYYATRTIRNGGKSTGVRMHREIMGTPRGMLTDHRDGNGLNNQRSNLRVCNAQQNIRNSKRQNMSGYKGVFWRKDREKWGARIKVDKKMIVLGSFTDKKEAALAYDVAAVLYFGEFAKPNFPHSTDV